MNKPHWFSSSSPSSPFSSPAWPKSPSLSLENTVASSAPPTTREIELPLRFAKLWCGIKKAKKKDERKKDWGKEKNEKGIQICIKDRWLVVEIWCYPFTPLFTDLYIVFLSQSFSILFYSLFFLSLILEGLQIPLQQKDPFLSLSHDNLLQIPFLLSRSSKDLLYWMVCFCLWFMICVIFTHASDLILKKEDASDSWLFFFNLWQFLTMLKIVF